MEDLHVTGIHRLYRDEIALELSDGRVLIFSLGQILTLKPERILTNEDTLSDDV